MLCNFLKDAKETNEAGSKNINDSNIEEVEKASSNDGNNDTDDVVVEAKRRRKSPPVQIRQKEQEEGSGLFSPQRPPSSSLSEPSCEEPKRLSLKSPLDLEAITRGRDEAMSPRNKSETEMASGSIQAALAALQAGQSSLNQVCKRIIGVIHKLCSSFFQNFDPSLPPSSLT